MRFLLSSLLSLVFLFVCCANSIQGAQNSYAGRSAPIQFQPQQPADLFCVLQDPSARYFSRSFSAPNEMSVVNVFDGAATAMGLSALNQDRHSALNTDFVHENAFDRPRANVFIGVDAVGRNNVEAAVMPHLFEMIAERRSSSSSSLAFSLSDAEPSLLSPPLSTVASIATGSPVSAHGIVNHVWQGKHGSPVSAYSSDSSSWAHRATFADILSQAFSGRSMTVSFSSEPQVAAAFGVNTLLQQEKPSWNNFIISLDESGDAFAATQESSSYSAFRRPLSALKADVLSAASFLHQISRNDQHFQLTLKASDATVELTKGQSTSVFDLNQREDLMFLAELQYIHALPELLHSTEELAALTTDSFPDALAINVASTDELAMSYGNDSEKFKAALMLLDAALPSLQHRLFALYPERAVGELVATGSPAAVQLNDERAFLDTVTKFANYPNLEEYFPLFYIPATQAADSCAALNSAVHKFGLKAECAQDQALQASAQAIYRADAFSTNAVAQLSNFSVNHTIFIPTYYPSENGIEKFQIVLWVSVLLAFVLLGVVYGSAYMSFKKDTMLYSTFNPRWEDKKHR